VSDAPWHVYPEQSAAGLWTTPTDLARFAIEIQKALRGDAGRVLTQALAREMVTPVGVGQLRGRFLGGEAGRGLVFHARRRQLGLQLRPAGALPKGIWRCRHDQQRHGRHPDAGNQVARRGRLQLGLTRQRRASLTVPRNRPKHRMQIRNHAAVNVDALCPADLDPPGFRADAM